MRPERESLGRAKVESKYCNLQGTEGLFSTRSQSSEEFHMRIWNDHQSSKLPLGQPQNNLNHLTTSIELK